MSPRDPHARRPPNDDPLEVLGEFCHWPKAHRVGVHRRQQSDIKFVERESIIAEVKAGATYDRVGEAHDVCARIIQRIVTDAGHRSQRSVAARQRWERDRGQA